MGRFSERLLDGSGVHRAERETDGFVLTGEPGHLDEFSDLVREANDHSGQDFIVFTTIDGASATTRCSSSRSLRQGRHPDNQRLSPADSTASRIRSRFRRAAEPPAGPRTRRSRVHALGS